MDLTFTLLTSGSAQSAASATTAAVATPANTLILLVALSRFSSAPNVPTATGLTFTAVGNISYAAARHRVSVLRAVGTGATQAFAIDFNAQSQSDILWHVYRVDGIPPQHATQAVVQAVTAAVASPATENPLTLGAFADPFNASIAFFGIGAGSVAVAEKSGWTELAETTVGSTTLQAQVLNRRDLAPNATFAANACGGIALEIAYDSSALASREFSDPMTSLTNWRASSGTWDVSTYIRVTALAAEPEGILLAKTDSQDHVYSGVTGCWARVEVFDFGADTTKAGALCLLSGLDTTDPGGIWVTMHSASVGIRLKHWDGNASVGFPDGQFTLTPQIAAGDVVYAEVYMGEVTVWHNGLRLCRPLPLPVPTATRGAMGVRAVHDSVNVRFRNFACGPIRWKPGSPPRSLLVSS